MDSSRDRNILTASPPTEDNPNIPPTDCCPLLETLLAEIRNYIYELTLVDQDGYCVTVDKEDLICRTALTRTCRQIREEPKNIIFSNQFAIHCGGHDGDRAAEWILSLDDKMPFIQRMYIIIDLSAEINDEIKAAAEVPSLDYLNEAELQAYDDDTLLETLRESLRYSPDAAQVQKVAMVEKQYSARSTCFELANRAMRKLGNTICTAIEDGKLARNAVQIDVPEDLAAWNRWSDEEFLTREIMLAYMYQVLFFAVLTLEVEAREWEEDTVSLALVMEYRNAVLENEVWKDPERFVQLLGD